MSPGQGDARFRTGLTTALDYLTGGFRRQLIDRPAENGNGHQRRSAHGVNVADGVGCRNSSEGERIVHDRHEKVCCTDDGGSVAQVVNGGIVAFGVPNEQVGEGISRGGLCQNLVKDRRSNLATASRAV